MKLAKHKTESYYLIFLSYLKSIHYTTNKKIQESESTYCTLREELSFFIWIWPKAAPNAIPKPMPSNILFWDTPIVIPNANPAHQPIILCVIFFIQKYTQPYINLPFY